MIFCQYLYFSADTYILKIYVLAGDTNSQVHILLTVLGRWIGTQKNSNQTTTRSNRRMIIVPITIDY